MKLDFLANYKCRYDSLADLSAHHKWDIYVSAYNSSQRVNDAFNAANASHKLWVVVPEYAYTAAERPAHTNVLVIEERNEYQLARSIVDYIRNGGFQSICIDITGFMRPQILAIMLELHTANYRKFDALYSEPDRYRDREDTKFSKGDIDVRLVYGFEGSHEQDTNTDVLIVASGFDHEIISYIFSEKPSARKVEIYGMPSLRPEMYQQSILRLKKCSESFVSTDSSSRRYFATAADPFHTVSVIEEIIESFRGRISNLYLSPLSTKPQTLGFGIYYLKHLPNTATPTSVIFPFTSFYERDTGVGISSSWVYEIEI